MLTENVPVILNLKEDVAFEYAQNPPFGTVIVPITLWFDLTMGQEVPNRIHVETTKDMALSPFCSAIHYGQSVFEGMKAFRLENDDIGVFRPKKHAKRFAKSAERMAMVPFSEELFLECIELFLRHAKKFVPKEKDHALYLRPILFANDPVIKVNPSNKYRFMIMASIVGNYFSSQKAGSKVLVNTDFVRAFPGGTGEAKTSANYAMSLQSLEYAKSKGYEQVLYLDAVKHNYFEELGGMNFFLIKNYELITPKLNGQILHGVTRDSIIQIARDMDIKCRELDYTVADFIRDYDSESLTEVFATGTAAVVTPIIEIGIQHGMDKNIQRFQFSNFLLTHKLREHLEATQRGLTPQSKSWLRIID